jgi:hypothetical protein
LTTKIHHETADTYQDAAEKLAKWMDDNILEHDFVIGCSCTPLKNAPGNYIATVWYRTEESETTYGKLKGE